MPLNRRIFIALCGVVSLLAVFASEADSEDISWDPRVKIGTLENGLQYAIYDSKNDEDPFNLRLIVGAGSIDEQTPSGLAHIVEHMVFRRTKAHPLGINNYITGMGWRQGLQVNAMTRASETQFMVRTRPNDALDLDGALALLAQLGLHADLQAPDWDKEKFIVLEELRQGNSVSRRVNDMKKRVVRAGSRYADRPTIGTRAGIEATTINDIRSFYERFYLPANMKLVISGAVEVTQAERLIAKHFGSVETAAKPERDYVKLPLEDGLDIGRVQDPMGTSSRVAFGFRLAMPDRKTSDGLYAYLQNYFIRRLVRDQFRARSALYEDHLDGLAVTMQEVTNERLVLAFSARSAVHEQAMETLLTEIEYLRQTGLSEEAFEALRQKAIDISTRNISAAEARSFERWEDKITSALMQDAILENPADRSARNIAWIKQMTLSELNARLTTFLAGGDQFLYFQAAGGAQVVLPDAQTVRELRQAARQRNLIDALPPSPVSQDEPPLLAPELPEVHLHPRGAFATPRSQGENIVGWHLPNGDRVVWLKHENADDQLYIRGFATPGFYNATYPSWLSQSAVQLWDQSGFDFWDESENQRWKDTQRKSWDFVVQDGQLSIGLALAPGDLEQFFTIYHHKINAGHIPNAATDALRSQLTQQAAYEERPSVKIARAKTELLFPGLNAYPKTEDIKALEAAKLAEAAQAHLRQPVTWYLVGHADEALLQKAFHNFVGTLDRESALTPDFPVPAAGTARTTLQIYPEDKATVDLTFWMPMEWSPERAFVLSTLTPLTQQALKAELRHRLGGVYTLQYEMQLDDDRNQLKAELSFVTSPERVEEILQAAIGVFQAMPQKAGQANIARLREDITYAEELRLKSPNTWLRRLMLSYKRYGDAGYLKSMLEITNQVTKKHLEDLASQVFQLENLKIAVGLPAEIER